MLEKTLAIVKPDAVRQKIIGEIIKRIEEDGLEIKSIKMAHMTKPQAEGFYDVHRDKPFFTSLVKFMTSGPVVLMLLEGENVINKWREIMGATDPAKAADGTIRKKFGTNIEQNCVHGSDAPETANFEINYIYKTFEMN